MRKITQIVTTILILGIVHISVNSQCKEYMEAISGMKLHPYTLDGDFIAPILTEGDSIVVHRTFSSGKTYKMAIVGLELFRIKVKITDSNKNLLFKNFDNPEDQIENEGVRTWEFAPDQSQNLIITVTVPIMAGKIQNRMKGCVGVLVGFK